MVFMDAGQLQITHLSFYSMLYSPWELNHGDAAGFSHGGGASSSSCWGKNGAWSKLRDEPYLARKDKSIMLIANVTSCTINLDKEESFTHGLYGVGIVGYWNFSWVFLDPYGFNSYQKV
ncbi:uncharacterized protein [Triticum aestivum]|uniref:uncharacterized protein isoform X4 n=1 Tax=Triticum aestivum TaxID=4565 RepID=UPI001D004AA1|nr:uncharacterized protein LOC123132475 isoform X4 [Triticum aestivum]